jgi:hypothetical protein
MKPLRFLMPLLLTLFLFACNTAGAPADGDGGAEEPPPAAGPADVRGTVTNLTMGEAGAGDRLGTILIEGEIEEDTSHDRASVTITNQTQIFDARTGERQAIGFEALQMGQRVEARFTGPVMESYPVQASASEVVILGEE